MTIVFPKGPVGYLRTVDQGLQRQASMIFHSGLKQVPEADEDYGLLIQEKQEAQKRYNNRFDILRRLPLDIVYHIIDQYFSQKELVRYTCICSSWRKLIINYSKIRTHVHANEWNDTPKEDTTSVYTILSSVSQHI